MSLPLLAAIDPWIFSFSALTVLVTIGMGFWAAGKAKSASDFFVAGRGVSVGWNASAISGEYLSAASFMGVAGMVMSSGYDALWYPVCYACGYLFLLLFIAGPLRRFGAYTIPDFAEGRYDSPLFRKIAVIFVLFIGCFYTMPQMKGAGTTLAYVFPGLPYWVGVVLVGAVITLNVAIGGMKGITLVQAFQYWLKMFAISVPVFVLMAVFGGYGKQLEINDGVNPTTGNARVVPASISPSSNGPQVTNLVRLSDQMSVESVNGWVRFDPPSLADRVEDRAKALFGGGVPYHMVGDAKLASVLMEYARFAGKPVVAHTNLDLPRMLGPMTIWETNWSGVIGQYAGFLTGRGIVVSQTAEQIIAIPSAMAAEVTPSIKSRLALPGKAPGDSTWLNPFGPLTTKAAKAAKLDAEQSKPYALLYTYSLIIALVCGTAGLPHILVRFYTNPDGVAAKRTTMWVMILIGVFYVFPPVFGVMGRNLMPALYEGSGSKGTDKVVLELPKVLDSTQSTPAEVAPPEKKTPWGSILSGIACAGAFAAFMSTFSGLLVSMTGALAHDVYGRILRPQSSPADRMRMFKWCAVLVGGVATLLGCFVEKLEINFMVGQAFAIAAASYFPLLFMSVWWRGMTMRGAAIGMLTGGVCALISVALTNASTLATDKGAMGRLFAPFAPLNDFWAGHPLLRILCEQPAIWCVPLAILLMIVISKATAAAVPADIRMKMLVLHAPEALGLKQEYIREHEGH